MNLSTGAMSKIFDLTPYIEGVRISIEHATEQMNEFAAGLHQLKPITITGWYDDGPLIAYLAWNGAGMHAPRKTKKAFKKSWAGRALTSKEEARLRRFACVLDRH